MGICHICKENLAIFSCNVSRKNICKKCCNDFQTCQIKKWENHIEFESIDDIDKLSENCLTCKGLIRDASETVKANNISSFTYNEKFIFHRTYNRMLFLKRRVLLELVADQTNADDLYNLAECYSDLNEIDLAIKTLETIIQENQYREVPLLLGKLYKQKGDFEKAEVYLLNSLEIDNKYSKTLRELADLYNKKDDYIKSIFYHDKALENLNIEETGEINDPFFNSNYIGLAVSYLKLKQYENVIKYAQEYLQLESSWEVFIERVEEHRAGEVNYINIDYDIYAYSTLYHLISLSYLELNNIELAEKYVDQVLELKPTDADINRLKGIIIGIRREAGQVAQYAEQLKLLKLSAEQRAGSFSKLRTSTPKDQVILITGNSSETIHSYLIKKIFNILRYVIKVSPLITPSTGKPAEEDRYTDLFKSHMDTALLDTLGWSTNTQSRAGFTKKETGERGGIGERDLVILSQEGNELIIGEALILSGAHSRNIKVHTQKIFGYDITSSNFHIVINWGFANEPDRVWNEYKELVNSKTSGVFPVINSGEIEGLFPDASTQGLKTFYTLHSTEEKGSNAIVVHVYVDLRNEDKRLIAEEARNN